MVFIPFSVLLAVYFALGLEELGFVMLLLGLFGRRSCAPRFGASRSLRPVWCWIMGAIDTESIAEKPKQFSMQGAPAKVLWWGIVVAVVGALLLVFGPVFLDQLDLGAVGLGQTIRIALELALLFVRGILPPLGAALIAAGIVMAFIQAQYPRRKSVRHNWK